MGQSSPTNLKFLIISTFSYNNFISYEEFTTYVTQGKNERTMSMDREQTQNGLYPDDDDNKN